MSKRGERYTDGEIATIRRLSGDLRTDEEIGLLIGRGTQSIAQLRARLGIDAGGGTYDPAAPVDPELIERIRSLAREGWSDERIGRSIGRTWSQVAALRKRFGIGVGNPKYSSSANTRQIAAEARRDAHIAVLRERKAARSSAEREGTEA